MQVFFRRVFFTALIIDYMECTDTGTAVVDDTVPEAQEKAGMVTEEEFMKSKLDHEKVKILGRLDMSATDIPKQSMRQYVSTKAIELGKKALLDEQDMIGRLAPDELPCGGEKREYVNINAPANAISGTNLTPECGPKSLCRPFKISPVLTKYKVKYLSFWIRKSNNYEYPDEKFDLIFVISNMKPADSTQTAEELQIFTQIVEIATPIVDNWVEIDFIEHAEALVPNLLPNTEYLLTLRCGNCGEALGIPVSIAEDTPPFFNFVVENVCTQSQKRSQQVAAGRRGRRELVACEENDYSNCCIRNFYVNFTEIGWDHFILQPPGYTARYCTGGCRHLPRQHTNPLHMQEEVNAELGRPRTKQLIPCCTADQFTSLDILVSLVPGDVMLRKLVNMVVSHCNC